MRTATPSAKAKSVKLPAVIAKKAKGAAAQDAVSLLKQDHKNVKALFSKFESLGDKALVSKKKIARQICLELTKHTIAEEEIFYSAMRKVGEDTRDMMDEATVEHAAAKDLIAQILAMEPGDDLYDAKVKVLSEQIEHHVKEEEAEMFPKAKKAKLNLTALGEAIQERKNEIDFPSLQ
ncbi:hemerythrin domain-containing protein [Undibacterium sp. CY18W]|uniref:Hemerythrin domain-containing protein n=1 Tax=Undibacterium hunanense TaxID=2762292 RepID=A0ABR6ZSI2_9BURK|nr:hemerythrin domain-containing protein [Undibacterium hunanense]MBC3918465.1 hemerythrin domain-containing protein [Undibacterium hunanense]